MSKPIEKVCPLSTKQMLNAHHHSHVMPTPCPNGEGRCPEKKKQNVNIMVKDVVHEKTVDEVLMNYYFQMTPNYKNFYKLKI